MMEIAQKRLIVCPECNELFKSQKLLFIHNSKNHLSYLLCKLCQFTCPGLDKMSEHILRDHYNFSDSDMAEAKGTLLNIN